MKLSALRGRANAILLVAILVLNSLYQSEIGGPGTIFNTIGFGLAAVLLLLNRRYHVSLILIFGVPLLLLGVSVMVNVETMTAGGFRSTLATAIGYLLLTLKPLRLDERLLRQLLVAFLATALALSFLASLRNLSLGPLTAFANPNFNINPNSAALFFFGCFALTLVFTKGLQQFVFAVGFCALSLTTRSRAALFVGGLLAIAFVIASTGFAQRVGIKSPLARRRLLWIAAFGSAPAVATYILPGSVQSLLSRVDITGLSMAASRGEGRDLKWARALDASQQSIHSIFFGYGPANAGRTIQSGTHSSYVEAFTAVGWPFMLSSVFALGFLSYYHLKRDQRDCTLFIGAIALYGAAETVLFNGLGNIWYVLILLSLYYRTVGGRQPPPREAYVPRYN